MAFMPYFVIGPTSFLSLLGMLHGPDKTTPTPAEDWHNATVDLLIPSYNEEKSVILCLAAIHKQTLKPRQIFLIDDASSDQTTELAKIYSDFEKLNIKIIKHQQNEGKTSSIYTIVNESDADVLAIVDADTTLKSANYLERIVMELYQGVGIASACGTVMSLSEKERKKEYVGDKLETFFKLHPEASYSPDKTRFQLMQRAITNTYRSELYLFLQQYIYYGEMTFFGTLIFPIGCAVVYRRKYLKNVFDKYVPIFGLDLTTSEDIFFGFALAEDGYRNIAVRDVTACTSEPRFSRLYHQIFKWSSSYLQSCFYFNNLILTPFKANDNIRRNIKNKYDKKHQKILEQRKIQEAYRQAFGTEYTHKFGRNIGWFIFSTLVEKIMYPTYLIVILLLQMWTAVWITLSAEIFFFAVIMFCISPKRRRVRNFFRSILLSPIRYSVVFFELFVNARFMLDLWITKNRRWRK